MKVVVAGGGLTGVYAAYFLAQSGVDVTVVAPEETQLCASVNNPGGLNPLHGPGIPGAMSAFALECFHEHAAQWPVLSELSGIDFNARTVERVFVAFTETEVEQLLQDRRRYEDTEGFSAEWVESEMLHGLDPRISTKAAGALYTTGNRTVNARYYRLAIMMGALKWGARFRPGNVVGVKNVRGRLQQVFTETEVIDCEGIVVATGAWVDWIKTSFGINIPVRPVCGELLLVELDSDSPERDVTWAHYGVYHHDGDTYWLGGTFDEVPDMDSPPLSGESTIRNGISTFMPSLSCKPLLQHVAGIRPVTPDGMPIVGCLPGHDNVWLALGAGSKGMLLSGGLGRTVADLVANTGEERALPYLAPERFHLTAKETFSAGRKVRI